MKTAVIAVGAMVMGLSAQASAYNSENYLKMQELAVGTDRASQSARYALESYEQGLSEAFRLVAEFNANVITVEGRPIVCVPSADVITRETISAAIKRIIGTYGNPKSIPDEWKTIYVSQHAVTGLSQMFPCAK